MVQAVISNKLFKIIIVYNLIIASRLVFKSGFQIDNILISDDFFLVYQTHLLFEFTEFHC